MGRAPTAGRDPGEPQTRVLFIAGGGRSGSTLLGNAVGSLPGAVSAGEIKLAFRRGLVEGGHCGCRMPVRECPLWGPALRRTFGRDLSRHEAADLDRRLTRLVRTRRVPGWVLRGGDQEATEVAEVMGRLIESVRVVSGGSVVVDSSKYPVYGALLQRSPRLDVRIVHIVRDPRAVAFSWQRTSASQQVAGFEEQMEQRSPFMSSMTWLAQGMSVAALWRTSHPRPMVVRYEDLVENAGRELGRVARFAGLEPDVSFVRDDGLHLVTSHAVAGNPSRVRSGPVELHRDDEWETKMPPKDQKLVSLLTAPARRHYGY